MENIRVALVSLGCAKNLVDSEMMLARLREDGYQLTAEPARAEVIIVNTCGFIETAKEESIKAILGLAEYKKHGCRLLLAAGCLAQRYKDELLDRMPELDGIVGTGDVFGISRAVKLGLDGKKVSMASGEFQPPDDAGRILSTRSHTAFIKIAEGCDNRCSYCAIPSIRGPYRSRKPAAVLAEAENLAANGVRELNLVAQDITCYGVDRAEEAGLVPLLSGLANIRDLSWIRLLYAYPERVDDSLLEIIAGTDKICRYLDLPLQHAHDGILKRMGRKITAVKALSLISNLRRQVPGITLRSSFIVGFPGEGESEFRALLEFLAEARLDRVGFFAYSREEGTPAAKFGGQVPESVKQDRLMRAEALQSRIISEKNNSLVGREMQVMLDGPSAEDTTVTLARSEGHAPEVDGYIRLNGRHEPYGRIVTVKISGFDGVDLLAEVCRT